MGCTKLFGKIFARYLLPPVAPAPAAGAAAAAAMCLPDLSFVPGRSTAAFNREKRARAPCGKAGCTSAVSAAAAKEEAAAASLVAEEEADAAKLAKKQKAKKPKGKEPRVPEVRAYSHPMTAVQAVAVAANDGLTLERANSASGFRFVQTLRDS